MMATDVIRTLCIAYPEVAHALRKLAKVCHSSSPKLQTAASLLGSHSRSMCIVHMLLHAAIAMRLGFDEGNVGLDGRLDWRVCPVG